MGPQGLKDALIGAHLLGRRVSLADPGVWHYLVWVALCRVKLGAQRSLSQAGKAAWRGCWHWAQRTRRMLRARKGDGPGLQAEGAERGAAGGCHAVLSVWAIFRVGDHEQCCLRDGGGCECQAKERALPQAQ